MKKLFFETEKDGFYGTYYENSKGSDCAVIGMFGDDPNDYMAKWDSIEVVSCEKTEELVKGSLESGKEYTITYVIDEKGLDDAIGLELVTTYTAQDGKQHVYSVAPFEVVKKEGDLYTFQATHKLENAGSFKVAYRMFPKNAELPHRQDFCYVRWFI